MRSVPATLAFLLEVWVNPEVLSLFKIRWGEVAQDKNRDLTKEARNNGWADRQSDPCMYSCCAKQLDWSRTTDYQQSK